MPVATAKITSKGQITLPAKVRKELGLGPGDRVGFERTEDGKFALVAKTHTFEDLRGILRYDGPPLSDQDIVDMVHQARNQRADQILAKSGLAADDRS